VFFCALVIEMAQKTTAINQSDCNSVIIYVKFTMIGPQLEKMMEQLRIDMESNPPLPGSYTPKKGEVCAAQFSADNQW